MTFLPDDYTPPLLAAGHYMKLVQGKNTFRIIGSAIVGWVWWTEEDGKRKPTRSKTKPSNSEFEEKPKHFIAFPIWNHEAECIQIFEVTQSSIRDQLLEFSRDPDWGDPKKYDIVIARDGEGLETTYATLPKPPAGLSEAAIALIKEKLPLINLEALYDGDDPFAAFGEDAPVAADEVPF